MELLNLISSLFALIILEIVLGIDNLVILSILCDKLPKEERKQARRWGLTFAWFTRLLLLLLAVLMIKLTRPLFTLFECSFSIRDLFLLSGGMFLIVKATQEIHDEVGIDEVEKKRIFQPKITFNRVVAQVALLDIVFSLDSVLTAVGLTTHFGVMALAITFAILVMMYASDIVSEFIERHPTIKMLALSFLMLIGMVLIADGFSFHVPRGYIYFAMGFSLGVESLNLIKRQRRIKKKKRNIC